MTPTGASDHVDGERPEPSAARQSAQLRLHIDVVTAEVTRAFTERDIRAILLKGAAVANWIYRDGESRPYVDADLLVNPADLTAAGRTLAQLGFALGSDDTVAPSFAEPHAVTWRRRRDACVIDLHWRIAGILADPESAWKRLSRDTDRVEVANAPLEVLATPARAVHLALHALHDGREGAKAMADLARGVERLDEGTWRAAAELAAELDSTPPFAAGLRLTPTGGELADRLELPRDVSTRWALWAQSAAPGAVRLHELAAAPGVRAKTRLIGAALAPPPEYMRALYPSARDGSRALLLAYLRRLLTGIRDIPGALRSVRRARAEARRSQLRK